MDLLSCRTQQAIRCVCAVAPPKVQCRSLVGYRTRRGRLPNKLPPNSYLVRRPIEKGTPLQKSDIPELRYGQHIYLYNNIQTDQVVYSLTRHLDNKDSLNQLTYLGKKTVPAHLRKDLWSPLAMVYFPSPHAGLAAYRRLREFRRLHEYSYNLEDITEKQGKHVGTLYPIKRRGRILMNQKANSVADLAAVLLQQEKGPSEDRAANAERRIKRAEHLKIRGAKPSKANKNPLDVKKELEGVEGVYVRWADMLDAEYAKTWPEAVVHDTLLKSRHTAAWPVLEREGEVKEQRKVGNREETLVISKEEQREQIKKQKDSRPNWRVWIDSFIPWKSPAENSKA